MALTEEQFMRQVTDLAELRGWEWVHFRPARTSDGWRTAASGTMAKGWPDLVLVRRRDRRLIFAELKSDSRGAKPRAEQRRVLELLMSLEGDGSLLETIGVTARVLVRVWRPADWPAVQATLR